MHSIAPSSPTIAIIGAGPAGLCLASLLHASPKPFNLTIYERDTSATSREANGGTLDLHDDTGLAALRKCELMDEFRKHARYDGDAIRMMDKNATTLIWKNASTEVEGPDSRPEIDRKILRDILLESIPSECLRWGRKMRVVTAERTLNFDGVGESGTGAGEGPFDLIIGADGGWSRVRTLLTDIKPHYAGISGYEMDIHSPSPEVAALPGKGACSSMSDRKALGAQRMGDGSLKTRTWFPAPEHEARNTLEKLGKERTVDKILESYAGWAPELLSMYREGDVQTLRLWDLYELPVGSTWEHKEGVTLIGDAASLATPFSGEGVNKAMRDALDLAELLERSQNPERHLTFDDAVAEYEVAMFPRARKMQEDTMFNKERFFGPDTPMRLVTGMVQRMTSDSESMFVRMLGSWPILAVLDTYLRLRSQIGYAQRVYWRRN